MKIRKVLFTVLGGAMVALGAIFIIIPGPSLLLIVPGLLLLSFDYPRARVALKKCQKMMRRTAIWLDSRGR